MNWDVHTPAATMFGNGATTSRPKRSVTPRELEVLALIADGCSTREIARTLWITEETVRTHVRRILGRLDARTRAHAVAIAFREDLWVHHDGDGEPM